MSVRAHSRIRCPRCSMSGALCLCGELRAIPTRTQVAIIMHYGEAKTSSNTGRLAHALLDNSEIRLRGAPGAPLAASDLISADRETLILFPAAGAEVLSDDWVRRLEKPVTLVVPDGNWNQARKVMNREPALRGARAVKLPPGPPSRYRLREAPRQEAICTIEAIARALRILEGDRGAPVEAHLLQVFETMVERVLWSRGHLKTEDAKTGIPEEAVRQRQLSGHPREPV